MYGHISGPLRKQGMFSGYIAQLVVIPMNTHSENKKIVGF